MIKIRTTDYSEYLFVLIALCGECVKKDLIEITDNPNYARLILEKLISRKLIRETKIQNRKTLRLSKNGYQILGAIPALKEHYDGVTNNHHKQNDPGTIMRRRGIAKMVLESAKRKFLVNGIQLEHENKVGRKKNITTDGSTRLDPLQEFFPNTKITGGDNPEQSVSSIGAVLENISMSDMGYYTSNVIKSVNRQEGQSPVNRSRMRGCLIGRQMIYAAYYQEGPLQFNRTNEMYTSDMMRLIVRRIYGDEIGAAYSSRSPKGEAVVLTNTPEGIIKILSGEWINGAKYLDDVFSSVYIAAQNTKTLSLITEAGWKKSLLSTIYTPKEISIVTSENISGYCDAIIDGNTMSTEVITMDLIKIKRTLKNLDNGMNMHIVCMEDQKDIVNEIYEKHKGNTAIEAVRI